ncbi:hypothetical protein DM01DRAFT_1338582 [Hesseltinella vesiculosa]|uniref:Uncharacterized protein n=1 Tax=Hesseltinella vesiculosa TaxID=101127 RepID=A0A1X2G9G5_9FUNG|nr:hypothetical protein DM01DRAFT_1338582 [Hesseltinella vesiculosa]
MDDYHAYQVAENLVRSTTPVSFQSSRASRAETSTKRTSSPSNYSVATPPPVPPFISHLPNNAVVIHPTSADDSFNDYIDQQFDKDGDVLKTKLKLEGKNQQLSPHEPQPRPQSASTYDDENPSTLWAVIHGDQANQHHLCTMPGEPHPARPWWSMDQEDGLASIGMFLFLFGFLFPPLWWIGAIFPRHSGRQAGKMASRWKWINRFMSFGFSILLVVAVIVLAILYSTQSH